MFARAQARVAKDVDHQLSRARWAIAIRGLFAIAFGAVILIWPGISLLSLTLVFGAFSPFYGVVTLGSVFSASTWQSRLWRCSSRRSTSRRLVSVLFGIVMFSKPGQGAHVLLALIA